MGSNPKIHNKSGQTIYLIPFQRGNNENPFAPYKVEKEKAKTIEAGVVKELRDSSDYDLSRKTNHFQIYILFRAAKHGPKVQRAAEEKQYTLSKLFRKGVLYLGLNAKGQVIEVDNTGQPLDMKMTQISEPHAASTQKESELRYLREQVKSLKEAAEALWKIVAALDERTG